MPETRAAPTPATQWKPIHDVWNTKTPMFSAWSIDYLASVAVDMVMCEFAAHHNLDGAGDLPRYSARSDERRSRRPFQHSATSRD
jgi:hypothetical protein